jgi:hypothetical protein
MKTGLASSAAAAFMALTLSACAHHPAPAVTPIGPNTPITVSKTVIAGATVQVSFETSINPDCSVRTLPSVRVLTEPMHGTAVASPGEDFPNFPPTNVRWTCNKNKAQGMKLVYTPAPGYVGPDYISYEVIWADGQDRTFNIPVTVK